MSKQELEEIVKEINVSLDIDKQSMMELAGATIPENISKQIAEIIAAQKEVSTRGIQVAPETSYKLGRLAVYRHDYDTALDYFKQATEADPKFSKAFEAIAWLRESQAGEDLLNENYDAAIKKLNEARGAGMHTDPLDPQALAVRGFVAQLLASIDRKRHLQFQSEWQVHSQEAAELFERAVQLDPNNPSAQSGLASVYAASGDFDAAIGAYERAIKLLPDYVRAYKDLALAYEGKMQADPLHADEICKKMLQAWKKFYQLAPKDPSLSGDYILKIGQRILGLESQGPQAESSRNE